MNLREQERFYQMFTRSKSRAASVPTEDVRITEMVNGTLVSKPAKKIEYLSTKEAKTTNESEPIITGLQKSKAGSTQTVVKEKRYDMGESSTGDPIYQCGIHDYETKSLKEFNQHVALLPHNNTGTGSKVASVFVQENKLKVIQDFIRSNGRI